MNDRYNQHDCWQVGPFGIVSVCSKGYRDESIQIYIAYLNTQTAFDLAQAIHKIFSDSFGGDVFTKTVDDCTIIAAQIIMSRQNDKR